MTKDGCPRCGSEELIYLFEQDRYDPPMPTPEYRYTWTYLECTECHLVFINASIKDDKGKLILGGKE
jgi:DNA-directed RNA polymerase subunit M/transcription elongation factor TFIIS